MPFTGGMRQDSCKIDDAGGLVDRGGLDGLMLTLAHDVEPTR
jgi:hypothetical protein